MAMVMEEDVASNYPSRKLPILDMEMWWEESTLLGHNLRHHSSKKKLMYRTKEN